MAQMEHDAKNAEFQRLLQLMQAGVLSPESMQAAKTQGMCQWRAVAKERASAVRVHRPF
jgi:hypothetical protein